MSDQSRKELASLSFTEKIKILEKLRRRSLAIAAAGLRQTPVPPDGCHSERSEESAVPPKSKN